jgi:hypothetical protein
MNYAAPPYPALPSDWNANVTTQNLLGTRLYGWLGCGPPEINQIKGAYDEFSTLVHQAGVMTGIDWTEQAAKTSGDHRKEKTPLQIPPTIRYNVSVNRFIIAQINILTFFD